MNTRRARTGLAVVLTLVLLAGVVMVVRATNVAQTTGIGYFANTNGLFVGDEVRILGVRVGNVKRIEPEPNRVKVTFAYDSDDKVPADAKAVILSPSLVTSRAIQLTPAYTGGPVLQSGAVIPLARTAVPVEFDDFRQQLQKLTEALQPTRPGGVSTLGAFVNTTADNLRGQGANIRDTITKLSAAFSALGDHSNDLFSTFKNLSILVSALHDSTDVLQQLNTNLAAVTDLLSNRPNELGNAVSALNDTVGDVQSFAADNRESLGTTSDKLASVTQALRASEDDIKQALHVAPNAFQNFLNIYNPAQAALTGVMALNNFSNPITFLCGAIQAASRLGADQSAKLCVQYLAPIIKNRQYNFLPIGQNLFVGARARPNEITYSEDWMRPDYVPPPPAAPGAAAPNTAAPVDFSLQDATPPAPTAAPGPDAPTLPAERQPTDAAGGLPALMVPPGSGS
jgi:phospholipid/cholesterol/gamma-HCH transport system substrate-binding protein